MKPNFLYPLISDSDRVYGAALTGKILRADGDWRSYLGPTEDQNVRGIESSACFVEAQQHAIATVQEEAFGLIDQNYSSRFNALLSNGMEIGGDPVQAAKSIKYDGLLPDSMMPFGGDIQSWEDFHSWKGVDMNKCKQAGKVWLDQWKPEFKIIAEKDYPIEIKYQNLREALKRGVVGISVCGWYARNGVYYKPQGMRDNHFTEAVYIDSLNRITVRDTYTPYEKILEANTNFEFAMVWFIEKRPYEETLSIYSRIVSLIGKIISVMFDATVPPDPVVPHEPLPPPPKYDWDTPILARHSVRVICDEEGLSVKDKNDLCATVGAESGWNPHAKGEVNTNGTRDWGIAQINDDIWIGIGKPFASTDFVLKNPEISVRWMCGWWKKGKQVWWAAYKSGAYKKFL